MPLSVDCNYYNFRKKLITTRLMEINLKVDDYIYNNKKITNHDAEKFIREVAAYKNLCSNDERCLQVIEKLTRIMKGIIAEQCELNAESTCNENYAFENSNQIDGGGISPVYSTPDEDRTQFTEGQALYTIIAEKDKEIINLCDSDDGEHLQDDLRHIPSMVVDVEVHRGMSELSLTAVNENATKMTPAADDECSQSILKNLEIIEVNEEQTKGDEIVQVPPYTEEASESLLKNIEINNEKVTSYTDEVAEEIRAVDQNDNILNVKKTATHTVLYPSNNKIGTVTTDDTPKSINNDIVTIDPPNTTRNILQTIDDAISTIHITSNRQCANNAITMINSSTATITKTVNNNNKIQETLNKNTAINNVSDNLSTSSAQNWSKYENSKNSQDVAATQLNTDVNSNIENKKHIIQNKRYKPEDTEITATTCVNTKHIEVNQLVNKEKLTTSKKKSKETVKKNRGDTLKKPPAKRTKNKNVKQPNRKIPIYNTNTVTDLSWVENIRFVREISDDEYDRQFKFEDEFWDNCSVPGILNDQDFYC